MSYDPKGYVERHAALKQRHQDELAELQHDALAADIADIAARKGSK